MWYIKRNQFYTLWNELSSVCGLLSSAKVKTQIFYSRSERSHRILYQQQHYLELVKFIDSLSLLIYPNFLLILLRVTLVDVIWVKTSVFPWHSGHSEVGISCNNIDHRRLVEEWQQKMRCSMYVGLWTYVSKYVCCLKLASHCGRYKDRRELT